MTSHYEKERIEKELIRGKKFRTYHYPNFKDFISSKNHTNTRIKFLLIDELVVALDVSINFLTYYLNVSKKGYLKYRENREYYIRNEEIKKIKEAIVLEAKEWNGRDNGISMIKMQLGYYLSKKEIEGLNLTSYDFSLYFIAKTLRKYKKNSKLRRFKFNKQGKNYVNILNEYQVTNQISRNFKTNEIYEKLAADITKISEGRLKIKVLTIIDFHSHYVWCLIKENITQLDFRNLVQVVYEDKLKSGSTCQTIIHTDQGTEFVTRENYELIKSLGFIPSVSDRGRPIDNSIQERFYGTLKECFDKKLMRHMTREELCKYIETKIRNYIFSYPRVTDKGILHPNEILQKFSF